MKNTEIERKWLVSGWPSLPLPLVTEQTMRQGYLTVRPTVRIREEAVTGGSTEYILCFKSGSGLVRRELEMPVKQEMFDELEQMIGLPLIKKIRRTYDLGGGLELEVNLVDPGTEHEFWYAEIEFPTYEEAKDWSSTLPELNEYLSREVTEVPGQTMGAYWVRTRLAGNIYPNPAN